VIPDLKGLSSRLTLGALGMTGVTAYLGLLNICEPRSGETVVVSGAAGAVGSFAGQIAKIKGCKTIGFAGSDDKVAYLKELGYDHAFNYKKTTVEAALKEAAPNGVDCYYDNVGGEMSMDVIRNMNSNALEIFPLIMFKELKLEGYLINRWPKDQFYAAVEELAGWIRTDKLKVQETIVDGFQNTPKAFAGLFDGTNTGKMIVKL